MSIVNKNIIDLTFSDSDGNEDGEPSLLPQPFSTTNSTLTEPPASAAIAPPRTNDCSTHELCIDSTKIKKGVADLMVAPGMNNREENELGASTPASHIQQQQPNSEPPTKRRRQMSSKKSEEGNRKLYSTQAEGMADPALPASALSVSSSSTPAPTKASPSTIPVVSEPPPPRTFAPCASSKPSIVGLESTASQSASTPHSSPLASAASSERPSPQKRASAATGSAHAKTPPVFLRHDLFQLNDNEKKKSAPSGKPKQSNTPEEHARTYILPKRDDPIFKKDPILTEMELELLWLGVESIYCDPDPDQRLIQWDFVWEHASPRLRIELRKLPDTSQDDDPVMDEKRRLNSLLGEGNERLLSHRRFQALREDCMLLMQSGYRRKSMALVVAKAFLNNRMRQNFHDT